MIESVINVFLLIHSDILFINRGYILFNQIRRKNFAHFSKDEVIALTFQDAFKCNNALLFKNHMSPFLY